MSHTPTTKSRCDACGAAYNGCSLHAAAPELVAALHELSEAIWSEPPIQTTPPGQAPVYRYVSDRLANAQENARTILARVKGE